MIIYNLIIFRFLYMFLYRCIVKRCCVLIKMNKKIELVDINLNMFNVLVLYFIN